MRAIERPVLQISPQDAAAVRVERAGVFDPEANSVRIDDERAVRTHAADAVFAVEHEMTFSTVGHVGQLRRKFKVLQFRSLANNEKNRGEDLAL